MKSSELEYKIGDRVKILDMVSVCYKTENGDIVSTIGQEVEVVAFHEEDDYHNVVRVGVKFADGKVMWPVFWNLKKV